MKLVAEQCSVISISNLQKTVRKIINRSDPEASEDDIFKYTEQELQKFKVNDQPFQYSFIKNQLGGFRWFFVCEKCKGRAQKLFLPPEAYKTYTHLYLCKKCHGLLNESVMRANNNLYKRVIKPLKKLRKIEEQLEKGHLQEKKIEELLNEYDTLDREMKTCPEYRLYAFKKKRGIKIS